MVIDQDLAVVLLDLRLGLICEYGETPAAIMLIDRAVVALSGVPSDHRLDWQSRAPYRA
jgi:hypothetical protein